MYEVVTFLEIYENVIYFILGLALIIYGWRFWMSWEYLRNAVYGLEREIAQNSVNRSAISLFLIFILGIFVFSIITFSAPFFSDQPLIMTPTLDLSSNTNLDGTPQNEIPAEAATITPLPTVYVNPQLCIQDRIDINSPEPGEVLRGVVNVEGTVDVEEFGFFQVEYARIQDGLWLPIAVEHRIIINGLLVEGWDTSPIPPGDYILQLLVSDNTGGEYDACRIQIRIEPGEE